MPAEPVDWRAVLALLANADTRAVFAEVAAASPPSGAARGRALARLEAAGLLGRDVGGAPVVAEDRLRATLAQAATTSPSGPERFLSRGGRIVGYPSRRRDRLAVLQLVAGRCLDAGEELGEPQLGERLAEFTDDVATLRRYLVDAGLLERSPDGRRYGLAQTPAAGTD